MIIRRAGENDMAGVNKLLYQVLKIHNTGRPDLFKENAKKYTDSELKQIFADYSSPVFVAVDQNKKIIGYAFCSFIRPTNSEILRDVKTLYIDDLCVDEHLRGQGVGTALYEHVLSFARANGCYNVTFNAWAFNERALKFYERCGLLPQKTTMEKIL